MSEVKGFQKLDEKTQYMTMTITEAAKEKSRNVLPCIFGTNEPPSQNDSEDGNKIIAEVTEVVEREPERVMPCLIGGSNEPDTPKDDAESKK